MMSFSTSLDRPQRQFPTTALKIAPIFAMPSLSPGPPLHTSTYLLYLSRSDTDCRMSIPKSPVLQLSIVTYYYVCIIAVTTSPGRPLWTRQRIGHTNHLTHLEKTVGCWLHSTLPMYCNVLYLTQVQYILQIHELRELPKKTHGHQHGTGPIQSIEPGSERTWNAILHGEGERHCGKKEAIWLWRSSCKIRAPQ